MAAKRPGTGSGKRPVHHPESTARITEARPQFNGGGAWVGAGRIQGQAARVGPESGSPERFRAKWAPVRMKKTRQAKDQRLFRSDSIGTDKGSGVAG
jgi:hypothetical protein